MTRPPRYLITSIRQVGGGVRRLYARSAAEASAAREMLCRDPTMIESIGPAEYVDVERNGTRTRYVLDGSDWLVRFDAPASSTKRGPL